MSTETAAFLVLPPEPIVLTVVGVPAPQGSKTRMPNGAMVDGTSKTGRAALVEWRRAVADAARRWLEANPGELITEPVKLTIVFRFSPVASDRYRTLHTTVPDLSKIWRSTEDALVHAALLADDRLVWKVDAEKRYCEPGEAAGCTVTVERFGWYETERRAALKAAAAEARRKHR